MSKRRPSPESPQGAATMRDVARAAGVSNATVSHVFSGRKHVSPETTERVIQAATELGYQMNTVARGLATGRSFVVALHIPFDAGDIVVNPFLAEILTTISTTASAQGYGFILIPADPEVAAEHARTLIAARRLDGALLLDPAPSDGLVSIFDAAGLPVVTIGRIEDRPDDPWVDSDLRGQVDDALGHLRDRGYHRPALLTVGDEPIYLRDTLAFYRAWCADAEVQPIVIEAEALTEDAAFRAIVGLGESALDSVLCPSDAVASGALRAVQTAARWRDDEVAVIGIGDSFFARHAHPPLTSIATFPAEKGRIATELLLSLIEGHEPRQRHVLVAHQLVVRDSTPARALA